MTRTELADAMWKNMNKLPKAARDRLAIINIRDYVDAVADDLELEKVEANPDDFIKALNEQPYDAMYAHHSENKS